MVYFIGVIAMNNQRTLKYWSWFGAFSVSALFWSQMVWICLR
nr:small membrane protein YmiC [Franconibacter pulveris]